MSVVVATSPPAPDAKHSDVLGQLIPMNGPLLPAWGSVDRLKLTFQVAPPLVVVNTWPGVPPSVAKQVVVVGQLTAVMVVAVPTDEGGLHVEPPLVVVVNMASKLVAKHVEVLGQLRLKYECVRVVVVHDTPLFVVAIAAS
jgi:hypothetical protein